MAQLCAEPQEISTDGERHEFLHTLFFLFVSQVCVNVQDHFLVCMPHPALGCFQVDICLVEHRAEGVSEIVAADVDLPIWR